MSTTISIFDKSFEVHRFLGREQIERILADLEQGAFKLQGLLNVVGLMDGLEFVY